MLLQIFVYWFVISFITSIITLTSWDSLNILGRIFIIIISLPFLVFISIILPIIVFFETIFTIQMGDNFFEEFSEKFKRF